MERTIGNGDDDNNNTTILTLRGTIRDFLQSPHCAANYVQDTHSHGRNALVCKSRAAHQALNMCATWHERTVQPTLLIEVKSQLFLVSLQWLKPLSNKGWDQSRVLGENPRQRVLAIPHRKARKFKSRPNPYTMLCPITCS